MATDPQAQEMATYPMAEWLRWDREHHGEPGHPIPIDDCPICKWGCQVADCECPSAIQVAINETPRLQGRGVRSGS